MTAPHDPGEFSPSEAAQYWIDTHGGTDHTVQTYFYQVKEFVAWCEEQQIDTVAELTGWHFDQFERERLAELDEPISAKGQMSAVRQFVKYLERIEAVEEGLHERVHIPRVERSEQTSDVQLHADDATPLLQYFRDSTADYASPRHAVLEVLWNTGCRLGGLRALDLGDYDVGDQYLAFRHRPQTDTPLKNKEQGQRMVSIPDRVCDVLDHYVARDRSDVRDDHGRDPLYTTRQGRPSASWIRCLCYLSTQPCVHMRCPHGNELETCGFRKRNKSSQCPSSRSPHQVRTGSITWQLNRGIPLEVVAERVNSGTDTIRRFYDKALDKEKMEQRRRQFTEDLDI